MCSAVRASAAWLAIWCTLSLAVPVRAETAARIVSTSPSITESLFALGLGDRVVGVSTYCHYPPAVVPITKIGTFIKPDAEKIAVLRPDLVVVQKAKSPMPLAGKLAALGIRYVEVE